MSGLIIANPTAKLTFFLNAQCFQTSNPRKIHRKCPSLSNVDSVGIITMMGFAIGNTKLIGSIFDDKIEFDGKSYRTNSYNKVLELIYEQTNELRGVGKRKEDSQNENPQFSTRTRDRTGMGCPTGV